VAHDAMTLVLVVICVPALVWSPFLVMYVLDRYVFEPSLPPLPPRDPPPAPHPDWGFTKPPEDVQ